MIVEVARFASTGASEVDAPHAVGVRSVYIINDGTHVMIVGVSEHVFMDDNAVGAENVLVST